MLNANIRRHYRSEWLPFNLFTPRIIGSVTVTGNPETASISAALATDDGDLVTEIGSLKLYGLSMNTDGRTARCLWVPPNDIDYRHPVYCNVHWTSQSTDLVDMVLWKVWHKTISANNDVLTATVDTALSTVLATDTNPGTLASKYCVTSMGKLEGSNENPSLGPSDAVIWSVEMDTKDTDMAEDLQFLGLRFFYVPLISGTNRDGVIIGSRGTTSPAPTI